MRRPWVLLGAVGAVGVVSLALAAPAEAVRPGASSQRAESTNTTAVEGREAIKTTKGGLVHSLTLLCGTAPCEVAVFDSTAAGTNNSGVGTNRWELRASASNSSVSTDFGGVPLVTTEGIVLEVQGTGANAWISYE